MRTKRIKLYKFNELSEAAKEKAIERLSDINVDFDWWENTYEDFKSICKTIGVDVNTKQTYFSGFYSQGSGSSFTADIDILELIEGVNKKAYLEYAPNIEKDNRFTPSQIDIDKRVLDLIKRDFIDVYCSFTHANRETSVKVELDTNYSYNKCVNYSNIDKELDKMETWLDDIASELNSLLYNLLEKEYEYLTSEETVIETIEANEYEFLENGTMSSF